MHRTTVKTATIELAFLPIRTTSFCEPSSQFGTTWTALVDLFLVQARRQRLRELVRLLLVSDAQSVQVLNEQKNETRPHEQPEKRGRGRMEVLKYIIATSLYSTQSRLFAKQCARAWIVLPSYPDPVVSPGKMSVYRLALTGKGLPSCSDTTFGTHYHISPQ